MTAALRACLDRCPAPSRGERAELDTHEFLRSLAVVLCTAGVVTVVFQRLRQPIVLGYIVAGLLIGPHVPVPLVADPEIVRTLSELGVILLMFSLGLEFHLRKLLRLGAVAALIAIVECSIMVWLGFSAGRWLGWTVVESLFAGSIVAISSTTIIARAFDEQGIRGGRRDLVVGILIVEDLIAILLMASLTAIAAGSGLSASAVAATTARLAAFLAVLLALGLLVVPRAVAAIRRLERAETTLVASVGICFAVALLAERFGYSLALGAFVAGSLIAESGEPQAIERLIQPLRDLFAAVFFVSVGMLVDPALVARHGAAIAAFTLVVVAGKIGCVSVPAFLTGNGLRASVQAGMSMAQIGEFSFIIAALGLALGATREFLYPVAVAVSVITTMTTPWLIRASGPAASLVDRKLPRPLQTFAALYGSWIERLRQAPRQVTRAARLRRLARLLALDAALLAAVVIGASLALPQAGRWLEARFGLGEIGTHVVVIAAATALGAPFAIGIARLVRRAGETLAAAVFPAAAPGRADLAHAPRRALEVTLQVAGALLVGLPLLVVTQPFLPRLPGALLLGLLLLVLGIAAWRHAANLHGHVRAGAEMIVEVLAAQTRTGKGASTDHVLEPVERLLPGLGTPAAVQLDGTSPAVGRTLAELNLRGLTGATVLAIERGPGSVVAPTAREVLKEGDVLALTGTHEAVTAASALLQGTPAADFGAPGA